MSDFHTQIACTICQNPFDVPKFVDCLHTFCESCIVASATVDQPNIFTCPVCKLETTLIDGSTKYLGTNSYISSLQSVYSGIQAGFCIVCSLSDKEVNSSHICLSCKDQLCEICARGHTSSTLTASHRVVSIEELKGQITQKTEISCHVHPCSTAKAFCHSCCKPICVECVLSEHKTHPSATLENAVKVKLKNLSKKIQTESIKPVINEAVHIVTSELEQLELEEMEFFKALKENTDWVISKVEKESQDVAEKGRKAFADERKIREKRLEQAKYHLQRRENILEVCSRFLASGGLEVLETGQALQKGLKLVTEQNQQRNETLKSFKVELNLPKDKNIISFKEVLPMKYENSDSTSLNENDAKGETNGSMTKTTKAKKKSAWQDIGDPLSTVHQVTGTPNNSEMVAPSKTKSKKKKKGHRIDLVPLTFKRGFSVKVSTDKAEPEISCMQFRQPDTCLLMDNANRKLKVIKLSGQLIYLVNVRDECPLFDRFVHFSSGDLVFAVFENKLFILNRHLKVMSEIPLIEKKSYATSPVVANYGDNVLVGNLANNEMRVLNEKGEHVRSWTSKFNKNYQQHSITYVAEDKVVMTSFSEPGHVMFESETLGNLLTIDFGVNNSSKSQPSQAVVDSKGNLIYCDPKQHTISVFNTKGLLHVCHNTSDQGMKEPKCLMLDSNDDLYVSCQNGRVAVYEVPTDNV